MNELLPRPHQRRRTLYGGFRTITSPPVRRGKAAMIAVLRNRSVSPPTSLLWILVRTAQIPPQHLFSSQCLELYVKNEVIAATSPCHVERGGGRVSGNTSRVKFELGSTTSAGELKRETGREIILCRKKRKVEMSERSSRRPQDTATQKSSRRVFQRSMKGSSEVSIKIPYIVTPDFQSHPACSQKCLEVPHLPWQHHLRVGSRRISWSCA